MQKLICLKCSTPQKENLLLLHYNCKYPKIWTRVNSCLIENNTTSSYFYLWIGIYNTNNIIRFIINSQHNTHMFSCSHVYIRLTKVEFKSIMIKVWPPLLVGSVFITFMAVILQQTGNVVTYQPDEINIHLQIILSLLNIRLTSCYHDPNILTLFVFRLF